MPEPDGQAESGAPPPNTGPADGDGLAGAVAIVTGGTRGIGRAVVDRLAAAGTRVLCTGRREETVAALRESLARYGDAVTVVQQDMAAADAGPRLVQAAADTFGRLDIVVNNAGGYEYKDSLDRSDWLNLFELKTVGYWSLATAAYPYLQASRGAVVNVAGTAGVIARPTAVHVAAVNAGVISMTESLALAWAGAGVRVNAVSPGATDTDRFATRAGQHSAAHGVTEQASRAALAAEIPAGHPADPREVARVIVMLSSPALTSVTGTHVIVDGGSTLGARRRS
jgi:NAD(P)-dependent dehydrogenase (short-subunit alcohol dehydrogenase family)